MKPRASFIIPVKDGAAYLAECLDSCLDQTQDKIEIIVIDDGSKDSTGKLLDYYSKKDPRIKAFRFGENKGRSAARNMGMTLAKSDLFLMLDADDLATPNRVTDTLNFFQNHRENIVYGEFSIINPLGVLIGNQPVVPFNWQKAKKNKFFYIGHSTMAIQRQVFEHVQYTDGEFSQLGIDDWKFQLDAYKAGFKFGAVRRLLAMYRWIPKERDEKRILELKESCLK